MVRHSTGVGKFVCSMGFVLDPLTRGNASEPGSRPARRPCFCSTEALTSLMQNPGFRPVFICYVSIFFSSSDIPSGKFLQSMHALYKSVLSTLIVLKHEATDLFGNLAIAPRLCFTARIKEYLEHWIT
jgi:hypothetical protein